MSKYTKYNRSKYSMPERTGYAYRLGREGKFVKFKNDNNRKAFKWGYVSAGNDLKKFEDFKGKK